MEHVYLYVFETNNFFLTYIFIYMYLHLTAFFLNLIFSVLKMFMYADEISKL